MAYFGRQVQKPLQKPGSGSISQATGQRIERVVQRLEERGRPARPERLGHQVRASRANRSGRKAR